jgi:dienelactone hydrolase
MAIVVLYHHVLGLTPGVVALADALRAGGHTVVTPDLFGGRTFATIDEGLAFVRASDEETLTQMGPDALPDDADGCVAAGVSFGAAVAAAAARRRSVRGVLSYESFIDPQWVGGWDRPVPLQVHAMAANPFFLEDEPAAREWVAGHPEAELVTYAGDRHLFTDSSTAAYDAAATAEVVERSLAFLREVSG